MDGNGMSNPTTKYLMAGRGGGSSSVIKGGQKNILTGGAKDSQKEIVGGKRYELGRSTSSRKM